MNEEQPVGGDEAPEETAEAAEAWYFDLPQGAWERQEQKNRLLRQTVKQNITSQDEDAEAAARRDPFRHRNAAERNAPPEPTWRLVRPGSAPKAAGPTPSSDWDDEVPWNVPVSAAEVRTAHALAAGTAPERPPREEGPAWQASEAPAGWDRLADEEAVQLVAEVAHWTEPEPGAVIARFEQEPLEEPFEHDELAGEPSLLALLRREAAPEPVAPPEPAVEAEPLSRWDEMFSAPAGDSMVDAMRTWSERANEPPEEMLKPFGWETDGEEDEGASLPFPAEELTPMEAELEEWSAVAITADAPEPELKLDFEEWPTELPETAAVADKTVGAVPWGETDRDDDLEVRALVGAQDGGRPGLLKRLLGRPAKTSLELGGAAQTGHGPSGQAAGTEVEDTAAPAAWPAAPGPRPQAATSEWQPEGEGAGTPAGKPTGALSDGDDRPATYGAWLVEPREDEPTPRSAEERDGAASVPAITVDDGAPLAGPDAAAFVLAEAAPLDAAVTQFDEYGEAAKAVAIDVDVMEEETTGPENPADPAAGADSAPDILHAGSVSNESPPERGPLRPEDDGTAKNGQTFERAEDGASGRLESPGSLPEPSGAPPWPPGSPSPETAEDDDPWAAFLSARESEGTVPFASPATVTPGAPVSWGMDAPDAPIGERDGDGLAAAPATTEDDDPWAAVVAASGYDDTASGSGQVYFKRRDGSVTPPFQPAETGEPAPDPIEAPDARAEIERRLFEPEIEFEPQPAPAAMEPEGDEWLREPFAAAETTAFTTDFATLPAADFWEDENDVVLKAFLEKANAAEDEDEAEALGSPESGPLEALFGRQAAEIEDEFSEPEPQRPSFAQAPPWAQPRSPGTSASVPSSLMRVVEPDEWTPPPQAGADGRSFGPMPPEPLPFGPFDDDERIPAASGARSRGKTLIRELVETGLLALLVFLAVRASFQNFKVDGNSMFPTLENGQFLIVNKLVYSEVDLDKLASFLPFVDVGTEPKRHVFHPPERGDIVVLRDPRRPDTDLIKRVVGLPGETIEIVDGKVAINGFRLEEPYIKTQWHYNMPRSTIPVGQYFVMGDNRDNSLDSRSAQVGPVPEELIIGKTMVSYWPSEKFGLAPNGNPKVTEEPLSASTKQATAP